MEECYRHHGAQELSMVTKDGRELDTDAEIKMHLVVCPRPCVPSQTSGLKEEGQSKDGRDEKQI